jgi:Skp family chaperone for outer membrane proteins
MKIRNMAVAAALFVGLTQLVGAANAQTKIYVIDEAKVRAESKVGKDISDKLAGIKKEGVTKLGLDSLQSEIKTEDDALKPQVSSLSKEALAANATLKARVDALNKKKSEFMQKAEYLDQNLEQQQNAALQAFAQALQPAVEYVGKEAGADVVLSSSSTWYFKNAIDLSTKVVARLDATTPSLAALQAAAQAAGPATGAGAAPAKAPAKAGTP